VPSRLEQGTTQLLNLIYQEGTPCSGTDSFPLENRAGRIAPALPHAARPERNVRQGTSPGNRIGILPRGRSRAGSRRACLHRKPPHLEARVHSRILPHSPRVSGCLEHDRSTRQQKNRWSPRIFRPVAQVDDGMFWIIIILGQPYSNAHNFLDRRHFIRPELRYPRYDLTWPKERVAHHMRGQPGLGSRSEALRIHVGPWHPVSCPVNY